MSCFIKIGIEIRKALESKKLTFDDLAKELKISKEMVYEILQGNKALNLNELGKIAKFLNLSLEDLVKEDPEYSEEVKSYLEIEKIIREYMRLEKKLNG